MYIYFLFFSFYSLISSAFPLAKALLYQPKQIQNWSRPLKRAYSLLKTPQLAALEDLHVHPLSPLDHLNGLLSRRSLSLVRSVLRSPWYDISERTKRQYTRKARQVISVALDDIAPQESENLWQALTSAQSKNGDDNVDK